MNSVYLLDPFLAWLCAGLLKFFVNSVMARRFAFGKIGYGGFPSNHSAITCSMVFLIAFREGVEHPAFGVALTLCFIVVLDAASLRREIGKHAAFLNLLSSPDSIKLRERMGHTKIEIFGGVIVGLLVAYFLNRFFPHL